MLGSGMQRHGPCSRGVSSLELEMMVTQITMRGRRFFVFFFLKTLSLLIFHITNVYSMAIAEKSDSINNNIQ